MKIKNFPVDARITFIGEIFKFNHLKSWSIKLGIKDGNDYAVKHSRLSNFPAFSKGRCLNPSDGQCRKGGYKLNFGIQSNQAWKAEFDEKNNTYYFTFDFERKLKTVETVHVRIPQIELARVLFFHNAYLARNCIDHGILSREFFIDQIESDTTVIHALPHCTFPVSQFNDEGIRRLLSWILIDPSVRRSYESISSNFIKQARQFEAYKQWRFNFEPPLLENISLETMGWFDAKTKVYTLDEILTIQGLKGALPRKVWFENPKFKTGKSHESQGASAGGGKQGADGSSVDDDIEADATARIVSVDIPKTTISFESAVETRKVVKKKSKGSVGGSDDEIEYEELGVGTDEATIYGTGAQGEFNGLEDESDVLELYMQRFDAFKLLVQHLAEKHNLRLEQKLHYLEQVGRSRLHRTLDGNRRCLLETQITCDRRSFVILEIDTSDNLKAVSTLVLGVEDFADWSGSVPNILKQVVKNSLRWPTEESLAGFGSVDYLNHPKHLVELTESDDEFKGWLGRLEKHLNLGNA